MVKFSEPFYVATDGKKVMVGGKSAEKIASDLEAGVARLGGFWRHPNYFEAYFQAASALIEQGRSNGTLDEIGLPAFYLQRHAIELLLKDLLTWLTNISDLRNQLDISKQKPTEKLLKDLSSSHNLEKIYGHILSFGAELDLSPPSEKLGRLIADMGRFETTDTWSRYSSSQKKSKGSVPVPVQHIPKEILIPIVEFQERLDFIATLLSARKAFGNSYEDMLHEIWSSLDAKLNH